MTITTTVTWQDLKSAYDDELADLREAYDDLTEQAREEHGEGWQNRPVPTDPDDIDDDTLLSLWVYQQQARRYDQAAQSIQNRQHMLGRLQEEYGDGDFELKMLTGAEAMDIETELRMAYQSGEIPEGAAEVKRNALTVDAATVDAPEGIPREDGSPAPSDAPNALTLALWEQVESFNNAGAVDFSPEGFGDHTQPGQTAGSSATPTTSPESPPTTSSDETN